MATAKRLVTFVEVHEPKVHPRAASYGEGPHARPRAVPGFRAVDVYQVDASHVVLHFPDGRWQVLPPHMSVEARHELELTDGRRVLLLNDRGWSSSDPAEPSGESVESIKDQARDVVGPDSPAHDYSDEEIDSDPEVARQVIALEEEEARAHWATLQQIAQQQGVVIDADELRELPHDVVLGQRLLARIGVVPDR